MRQILAIDQGTTSSRAIIFDENLQIRRMEQKEFPQYFPDSGWVEHDAEEIWNSVVEVVQSALAGETVEALGITNQRETVVLWEKSTGKPVYHAIVWQDRRTAEECERLKSLGLEALVIEQTGLRLDPYFSATKLAWLLDHVAGAREKAEAGELLFGTIDCFLIWRLTGGTTHATDATNAARTMLYDIHKGEWSQSLCDALNIPMSLLPTVKNCADDYGQAVEFGHVPILAVAGDQQAAAIGQACFEPGMMKSTYGTGCFALLNTGENAVRSQSAMLTTIAYQFDNKPIYALEGSIYIAGAVVQWLRDGLKIISSASESGEIAQHADDQQDIILVPAFTGLGAPYWKPNARGAMFGLTRNTSEREIARAALQSIGFQTRDLLQAMRADWPDSQSGILRVDGGMSASDYTMQFLADICQQEVQRPKILETTALGVAWLAGNACGIYPDQEEFARNWNAESHYQPQMDKASGDKLYQNWQKAIDAVIALDG